MGTSNKREKKLVRERMSLTGENYTTALAHVRLAWEATTMSTDTKNGLGMALDGGKPFEVTEDMLPDFLEELPHHLSQEEPWTAATTARVKALRNWISFLVGPERAAELEAKMYYEAKREEDEKELEGPLKISKDLSVRLAKVEEGLEDLLNEKVSDSKDRRRFASLLRVRDRLLARNISRKAARLTVAELGLPADMDEAKEVVQRTVAPPVRQKASLADLARMTRTANEGRWEGSGRTEQIEALATQIEKEVLPVMVGLPPQDPMNPYLRNLVDSGGVVHAQLGDPAVGGTLMICGSASALTCHIPIVRKGEDLVVDRQNMSTYWSNETLVLAELLVRELLDPTQEVTLEVWVEETSRRAKEQERPTSD